MFFKMVKIIENAESAVKSFPFTGYTLFLLTMEKTLSNKFSQAYNLFSASTKIVFTFPSKNLATRIPVAIFLIPIGRQT